MPLWRSVTGWLALLCAFSCAAAPAKKPSRKESSGATPAATVEELARRMRPSVVVVSHFGRDGKEDGVGAGFVISSNGLIATSLHVIGEARPVTVRLTDGREREVAEVFAWDRDRDLAIVRIDATDLKPLPLGDSDELKQGVPVVAMGNPLGMEHSVVQGVVSAKREFDGIEMIQLAIPIEPGNSGGPLVDMQGRVHGLLSWKAALTPNLGFATSVNELKKLLARPNPVPMTRWLTIGALNPREWLPLMGARWTQRGGRLLVEGQGKGFGGRSLCLSHKPVPDRPYEVAVSVRLDDEAGAAGLVFEADGSDTHYGFYPTAGQLRLTRFEGPTVFSWKILATTNSPKYRPGDWNDLRVRVESDKLLCYVNEKLVIESADAELKLGKAGLAKFRNTRAEFRNFRIGASLAPAMQARPELAAQLKTLLADAEEIPAADLESILARHPDAGHRLLSDEARNLERRAAQIREFAARTRRNAVQVELVKLMKAPEPEIDLFHAALLVSKLDNPDLDINSYREQLEAMAAEIKAALPAGATAEVRLRRLIEYFSQSGYHGSRSDYYDHANSHIDRVIDDREGLPITLSVLFLELARRIDLEHVSGAPLPGHFMVLYNPGRGRERVIDVFDGAKSLTIAEAEEAVAKISGSSVEPEHFAPASKRDIVIRILRNLANSAERNQSPTDSLRYLDTIVALAPDAPMERLGRAMARLAAGQTSGAREDLRFVLDAAPPEIDLRKIENLYKRLQEE